MNIKYQIMDQVWDQIDSQLLSMVEYRSRNKIFSDGYIHIANMVEDQVLIQIRFQIKEKISEY